MDIFNVLETFGVPITMCVAFGFFIWNGDNANGMTAVMNATQDADAASSTNFGSLTNVQADADSGSVDLEIYIAEIA